MELRRKPKNQVSFNCWSLKDRSEQKTWFGSYWPRCKHISLVMSFITYISKGILSRFGDNFMFSEEGEREDIKWRWVVFSSFFTLLGLLLLLQRCLSIKIHKIHKFHWKAENWLKHSLLPQDFWIKHLINPDSMLSPTVIGVGLHRLGANLTRWKGKYTSASPRCTCLPSRKICIGVALGDPPQTPLQCWLVGRTSTPRLRLGVLASQLVNIALKLHSVDHRWLNCNVDS